MPLLLEYAARDPVRESAVAMYVPVERPKTPMRYKDGREVFIDAWADHRQNEAAAAGAGAASKGNKKHAAPDVFYGACMKWNCMCAAYVVPTSAAKNTTKRGGPFCERCGYARSDHQVIRKGSAECLEYMETLARMKKASAAAGKRISPVGGFIKAQERLPPLQGAISSHTRVGEKRQAILASIQVNIYM